MIDYRAALIFTLGLAVGATFVSGLSNIVPSLRNCRGEVYSIPIPPASSYRLTAFQGRVYAMIEAPRVPNSGQEIK